MNRKVDLNKVEAYYSDKISIHGATPQGVDWNGETSQNLRFEQLCKLLNKEQEFSLLDFGCGYGALADFLKAAGFRCKFTGYDLSKVMLETAKSRRPDCQWVDVLPTSGFDFTIASGLFNVKLGHSDEAWSEYVMKTLAILRSLSTKGMAYNILTSYVDSRREDLYYADPCLHFDYCKINFSKDVALLHDYGLYEFTILARGKK